MVDEQTLAYRKQLLDYEEMGFKAAESGDYSTAVQIWTNVLTDAPTREFFEQSRDALMEIAWNLALVHHANGNESTARTILEQWGFSIEEYEQALAGNGGE